MFFFSLLGQVLLGLPSYIYHISRLWVKDKVLGVFENKRQEMWRQKNYTIKYHNVCSRWNAVGRIVCENTPRLTDSLQSVNSRPMYLLLLVQCGCVLRVCPDSERHYVQFTELLKEFGYSTHEQIPIKQQTPTDPRLLNCSSNAFLIISRTEALRYKPKGRGFDTRWVQWNLSLTKSFRTPQDPEVDSASDINEYQGYLQGVKTDGA
jgi:hypothetical protein